MAFQRLLAALMLAPFVASIVDLVDPLDHVTSWSMKGLPCGLPTFFDRLPTDAQRNLREIWTNYTSASECMEECSATRSVIESLREHIREEIFASRCGPSFLGNVSQTVQNEFRKVWFDHRLSLAVKEPLLKKLAYSLLNRNQLALFGKWLVLLQIRKEEFAKRINGLSTGGREALERWRDIKFQEKEFLAGLPKRIRGELETLYGHSGWNEVAEENDEDQSSKQFSENANEGNNKPVNWNTAFSSGQIDLRPTDALLTDACLAEQLINDAECNAYYWKFC
uniref:Uncharacterized protein n=1 Tax=Ascaris lumbricoides TaxID=6252 RepID=A0A0M3HZN2_ASCLU